MNADPAVQLRLLDLQAADTALSQLAHRRRTLPELATIAEKAKTAADIGNEVIDARTEVADIELEQTRLENDVETVRNRAARDDARLQTGGLPAKELEGLQHEIATLARRQSTLEDELLDVMERAEAADATLTDATARQDAVQREQQELEAARDATFAEIDGAVAQKQPERDGIAAELPADLVALYEKARAQSGHGAALLRQRRCEGCRIEVRADAVVRCDNCRAVLVRTAESGL